MPVIQINNSAPENVAELQNKYDALISERDRLNKLKEDLWEREKVLSGNEKAELFAQRQNIYKELTKIDADFFQLENKIAALKNGGKLISITDLKGIEHNAIPDFTQISSEQIVFDEDKILIAERPAYIPKISEEVFKQKGYVLDAIRILPDTFLIAIKGHKEPGAEYVLLSLDQLALTNDYYHTKAKALAKKAADEDTERNLNHWDKLSAEKREKYLNQKNLYYHLPVKIKNKISESDYSALAWEEKEKLYKFYKRHSPKKLKSRLEDDKMWTSFHQMYERFLNPEAVHPKPGYANNEVFAYWEAFRDMMKWKIKDITIQREDLTEMRKAALETSYGNSNTDNSLKESCGILVKRQNGSKINAVEISEIETAWNKINAVFGNLKPHAEAWGLKISHTGIKYVFASNAIGMFVPSMNAIAVSNKYGELEFKNTMAHEIAHWIDYTFGQLDGKRYATDNYEDLPGLIAFKFRKHLNKKSDSSYINATKECFARAFQQYFAIKDQGEEATIIYSHKELSKRTLYYSADNFVNKNAFKQEIEPLIDLFFSQHKDFFQQTEMPKPEPIKPAPQSSKRFSEVFELDRDKIAVDPQRFQGRLSEYSEETVKGIVSKGAYDKSMDPVIVWHDAALDKYIVLSGHSRFEASRRLYEAGQTDLKELPVKEFYGDADDAIDFAVLESNRASTEEGLLSDLAAYRRAISTGKNKDYLQRIFKPESKLKQLQDLYYLNPNGKFIEIIGQPDARKQFPYIERNAQWVGNMRRQLPALSDYHEQELFDYLYSSDALKISKEKFFDLVNRKVNRIDFNSAEPLNLKKLASPNVYTDPINDQIKEIDTEIEKLNKEANDKRELIVKARGTENENLIPKFQQRISDINTIILRKIEEQNKLRASIGKLNQAPINDLFSQPEPVKTETSENKVARIKKELANCKTVDELNTLYSQLAKNQSDLSITQQKEIDNYTEDLEWKIRGAEQNQKSISGITPGETYEHVNFGTVTVVSVTPTTVEDDKHHTTLYSVEFKTENGKIEGQAIKAFSQATGGKYKLKETRTREEVKKQYNNEIKEIEPQIKPAISEQKIIELGRQINATRNLYSQMIDAGSDNKRRLSPTPENLIRWMHHPGKFDLIGVDTFKETDATADYKNIIQKQKLFNIFNIKI